MWRREAFGAVQLLRCPLLVPAAATPFARILHLLSFAASSLVPSLWQAARFRPELVWAVEPTACAAPVALLAARLCGARVPPRPGSGGEARCSSAWSHGPGWGGVAPGYGWLVRRFDLVSTICTDGRAARELGVADDRLCLLPNWVDTVGIRPLAARARCGGAGASGRPGDRALRRQHGREAGSGAAGRGRRSPAGSAGGSPRAVRRRRRARRARARLEGLPNVTLLPLQPEGSAERVAQHGRHPHSAPAPRGGDFRPALQARAACWRAAGRVVAQAEGGELLRAARRCGVLVPPGDAAAMAQAIVELAADPARRGAGRGGAPVRRGPSRSAT